MGWSIAHTVVASRSEKIAMRVVPQSTPIPSDPFAVSIAQVSQGLLFLAPILRFVSFFLFPWNCGDSKVAARGIAELFPIIKLEAYSMPRFQCPSEHGCGAKGCPSPHPCVCGPYCAQQKMRSRNYLHQPCC